MDHAVAVTGLRKRYDRIAALEGVDFTAAPGALLGIIGADGAGKTTLLRILATLLTPDQGTARALDLDCVKDFARLRRQIGYMPQRFSLYEDLSVAENLSFFADIFDVRAGERAARMRRLLSFSRLEPFRKRRAGRLSGGMKQKLALSCALIHTPRLLLLDEPTTGVDPLSRREFWDILRELRSQGMTILVTTPYMDEAEYCDDLVLLHQGRLLVHGPPADLIEDYPLSLFAVRSSENVVALPRDARLPPTVHRAYPVAGALHVAAEPGRADRSAIADALKGYVPEDSVVEEVKPRAEDLFFYHLSPSDGGR